MVCRPAEAPGGEPETGYSSIGGMLPYWALPQGGLTTRHPCPNGPFAGPVRPKLSAAEKWRPIACKNTPLRFQLRLAVSQIWGHPSLERNPCDKWSFRTPLPLLTASVSLGLARRVVPYITD